MLIRAATHLLSPGGSRGRLQAFIFHRVLPAPDPLRPSEPTAEQFDRILGWIGEQFNVLPPLEACERLYKKSLPPRAAIITFDDGYVDNHDVALPLLLKHGMKAVFFIATGYLNGGVMFNDRVTEAFRGTTLQRVDLSALNLGVLESGDTADRLAAIDRVLAAIKPLPLVQRDAAVDVIEAQCGAGAAESSMMDSAEVCALLSAGMEIGGHTRRHPILRSLPEGEAAHEIASGREDLRAICGIAPLLFAYPNGRPGSDYDARDVGLVRSAGFRYAFTTNRGTADSGSAQFELPRHTPWARQRVRFRLQNMHPLWTMRSHA